MDKFKEWVEDLLKTIDELAKINFKTDTPEYNFQQEMIKYSKKYREARDNILTTCTESGITFNKKGEIVFDSEPMLEESKL